MHVDSGVELGRDDPALEIPWQSEDGSIRYRDIRTNPALIEELPEASRWAEMREFLLRANVPDFALQTAKSDVWTTNEISPEEEIFCAGWKFVSYVDMIFSADASRFSLVAHQELVAKLCTLLQRAPDMLATVEFIVRHCYYHDEDSPGSQASTGKHGQLRKAEVEQDVDSSRRGFCVTAYVSGFGDSDEEARQRWSIALKLLQNSLVQALRA